MDAFLSNYGLWILLAGIFLAMHLFGSGCGGHGGHQHGPKRKDNAEDEHAGHAAGDSAATGTTTSPRPHGCH